MTERPYYEEQQFRTSGEERRPPRKKSGGALEYLVILLVSFALVFGFVRPFVMEAFWIPSGSMIPTLEIGDRVLVNKFIYLIKRVVGLPGDTIAVRRGHLLLNGERQKEPYLNKKLPDRSFYAKTKVPKGHVFVMGDNRGNSADSRVFGPLPKKNIEGEAFLRFWPPHRICLL
jgi:signal peptidase I